MVLTLNMEPAYHETPVTNCQSAPRKRQLKTSIDGIWPLCTTVQCIVMLRALKIPSPQFNSFRLVWSPFLRRVRKISKSHF